MPQFNGKEYNDKVFELYRRKVGSTKENSLIKNGLFTTVNKYEAKMAGQVGGYAIVEPIKGRINDDDPVNYDGKTDSPDGKGRETYMQRKVCYGRQQSWGEDDFTRVITSTDFMAEAGEINEYWDDQLQKTMLAILKGISGITDNNFNKKHTVEIGTSLKEGGAEKAAQKVLGDKKSQFDIMFMHSQTVTNLNILNLIEFLKYTDSSGITRDLQIGTYNGKIVVMDDDMPVINGYGIAEATDNGALKVIASGTPGSGEILLADVKKAEFYPNGVVASTADTPVYVKEQNKYVTYMFKKGFFEREELSVPHPNELVRDAKTNGGRDEIISRIREIIVPLNISWEEYTNISPMNKDFANSNNWKIVNNGKTEKDKKYIPDKLIPFATIISVED